MATDVAIAPAMAAPQTGREIVARGCGTELASAASACSNGVHGPVRADMEVIMRCLRPVSLTQVSRAPKIGHQYRVSSHEAIIAFRAKYPHDWV